MNKIKIIFTDLDWTLLDHKQFDFDYESLKALNKAQENGTLVFIATARPYISLAQTGVFKYLKPDGIICSNGSTAFIGDKLLFNDAFPKDVIDRTVKSFNKHNACFMYITKDNRYLNKKKNKYVDQYFSIYREIIPGVKKYEGEDISALLLMVPESYDEKLLKELPDCIDYFRFVKTGVDVRYGPHNVNKGNGVVRVLEALNIPKESAMAIGDDDADVEMFKNVGIGVTLENGTDYAKANATYVTKAVENSGVAYALKHFNIIK